MAALSATLLNAYLAPVLVTYIADLEKRLNAAGVTTQQRFLMQSNGGVMPFAAAVTGHKTVHSLLSGPAAGAQASAYLPRDDGGAAGAASSRSTWAAPVATSPSSRAARRSK